MTNIAQAEREQVLWMPLLEALGQIQSVENSESVVAQVRIKLRIGCQVIPVKWADADGPNDKPNVRKLQRSQLVLSGSGFAPSGGRLRPLLVLSSAVYATWPQTTNKGSTPPEANSNALSDLTQWGPDEKYLQWMSLVEAVEHIRINQYCDSIEALRQLKREMRDGTIPVQWDDSEGPKDRPNPIYLHESELLLMGTGLAPDNVAKMYRPLLVDRSAVKQLWPLTAEYSSQTTPSSTDSPQKPPRKAVTPDEIMNAAEDVYREHDRPNIPKAELLIRKKLPGAKRDDIRKILELPQFVRRDPGNQPKE